MWHGTRSPLDASALLIPFSHWGAQHSNWSTLPLPADHPLLSVGSSSLSGQISSRHLYLAGEREAMPCV